MTGQERTLLSTKHGVTQAELADAIGVYRPLGAFYVDI
jgi:DNA-binding XRE family transcriptional regulator